MSSVDEEVVSITQGLNWTELRISCPDATGLGCDIARLMFEYGLTVLKGDFSTDGKWCFLLFHVHNKTDEASMWTSFRHRLEDLCTPEILLPGEEKKEAPTTGGRAGSYLLKVDTRDRTGALFDVVTILYENDIMVHRAHASTSPIGRAIDLFYISDQRKELPSESRVEQLKRCIHERLSDSSCCATIERAPEVNNLHGTSLMLTPSSIDNKSARPALPLQRSSSMLSACSSSSSERGETNSSHAGPSNGGVNDRRGSSGATQFRRLSSDEGSLGNGSSPWETRNQSMLFGGKVEVDIDNTLSRVHTVIQMRSKDRKGLLYDLLRTLKDMDTQVSYGKIEVDTSSGVCQMDVFVQEVANSSSKCTRIEATEMQQDLCIRVHQALSCPVFISTANVGSGEMCTQLIVGARIDSGGRGRPRVLYDTSKVLKQMSLGVFKMDMYMGSCSEWGSGASPRVDGCGNASNENGGSGTMEYDDVDEVHRFIVTDEHGQPIRKDLLHVLARQVHDALMDVS